MKIIAITVAMLAAFLSGFAAHKYQNPPPTYAADPDSCKFAGLKATGWSVYEKYKGGIENGGSTSFVKYECGRG